MTYATKRRLVLVLSLFTLPLAWPARVAYRAFGATALFDLGTTLLAIIPGTLGSYLRTSFYARTLTRCGYDFSSGFMSLVQHPEVEVGRGVYIGSFTLVGRGAVLADDVIIASRVFVQPGVRVGSGTWVGESALVMADVGAHCIVGAGCVQDRAVASHETAVGNPMRVLAAAA